MQFLMLTDEGEVVRILSGMQHMMKLFKKSVLNNYVPMLAGE